MNTHQWDQIELSEFLKNVEVRGNQNHTSRVTRNLGLGDSLHTEEEEGLGKGEVGRRIPGAVTGSSSWRRCRR